LHAPGGMSVPGSGARIGKQRPWSVRPTEADLPLQLRGN
jgi:hypothetical protein